MAAREAKEVARQLAALLQRAAAATPAPAPAPAPATTSGSTSGSSNNHQSAASSPVEVDTAATQDPIAAVATSPATAADPAAVDKVEAILEPHSANSASSLAGTAERLWAEIKGAAAGTAPVLATVVDHSIGDRTAVLLLHILLRLTTLLPQDRYTEWVPLVRRLTLRPAAEVSSSAAALLGIWFVNDATSALATAALAEVIEAPDAPGSAALLTPLLHFADNKTKVGCALEHNGPIPRSAEVRFASWWEAAGCCRCFSSCCTSTWWPRPRGRRRCTFLPAS